MALEPDLRVLCRKLAAATPADLPALCPVLVGHIVRCGASLSTWADQPGKSSASEASVLVHKVKTQVNTLLHGRTAQGRFAGMVMAKAIIDVGGWACLRTAKPWIDGMLALLQKNDPYASKELCLAALARIYSLLHEFPTLVREMATPTLPTLARAALQLVRPETPGKAPKAPMSLVEAVVRTLSALLPLYPTTLRPFSGQIRAWCRGYIAPTLSDPAVVVPASLAQAARRLLILLHYTAPKNGNADEWAKQLASLLQNAHSTADQVFRAVREARDPGTGCLSASPVSADGEPTGGGAGPEDLPEWTGLQSGADRLTGLLHTLAECFRCPTKTPVAVPLGSLAGLVSRLSLVLPPAPGLPPDRELSALFNPSIGREERDELWTALPAIHAAALGFLVSLQQRLGPDVRPLAPEMLEDALRMFRASRHIPAVRQATFVLVQNLLPLLGGASMSRNTVHSLGPLLRVCCQDLLVAAGSEANGAAAAAAAATTTTASASKPPNGAGASAAPGVKAKTSNPPATANADLFLASAPSLSLTSAAASAASRPKLSQAHREAAEGLLASLLAGLAQQHVKKADRALLDRTAILCANKRAMVASVLHPYVDRSGRYFANTIPFLAHAYAQDMEMEILHSNLRTALHHVGSLFASTATDSGDAASEDEDDDDDEEGQDVLMPDHGVSYPSDGHAAAWPGKPIASSFAVPSVFAERPPPPPPPPPPQQPPASLSAVAAAAAPPPLAVPAPEPLSLKRKPGLDDMAASPPKRVDTGATTTTAAAAVVTRTQEAAAAAAKGKQGEDADNGDSDSEGSVQLEMVLDGEDDEDDSAEEN